MSVAHVFDYDDTLSHSGAMIYAHPFYNGVPTELQRLPGMRGIVYDKLEYLPLSLKYSFNSRDFAFLARAIDSQKNVKSVEYGDDPGSGHVVALDFSDIIQVDHDKSSPIKKNMAHLEKADAAGHDIWVVTGRKPGGEEGIKKFIESCSGVSVPTNRIICVGAFGQETHKNKSHAFLTKILPAAQYKEIHFYDDDTRNLDEIKSTISPFANVHVINSITDEVSSSTKDRVAKAKERRSSGGDLRRIRKLSGIM